MVPWDKWRLCLRRSLKRTPFRLSWKGIQCFAGARTPRTKSGHSPFLFGRHFRSRACGTGIKNPDFMCGCDQQRYVVSDLIEIEKPSKLLFTNEACRLLNLPGSKSTRRMGTWFFKAGKCASFQSILIIFRSILRSAAK